jgi:hypothetical protein
MVSYCKFKKAMKVEVNYLGANKWWCPGVITGVDETRENDVLFVIALLDGDIMYSVPEKLLRKRKQQFPDAVIKTNSEVMVNFRDRGVWYSGRVELAICSSAERFSTTTSCDIQYDDGDLEKNVPVARIRLTSFASMDLAVFALGAQVQVDTGSEFVPGEITKDNYNRTCDVLSVTGDRWCFRNVPMDKILPSRALVAKLDRRTKYRYVALSVAMFPLIFVASHTYALPPCLA